MLFYQSRAGFRLIVLMGILASSYASAESVVRSEQDAAVEVGAANPNAQPVLPDTLVEIEQRYNRFPSVANSGGRQDTNTSHSNFIGKDLDLSGVGKGAPQFGTLVTGRYFVGAYHAKPSDKTLRFVPGTTYTANTYVDRFAPSSRQSSVAPGGPGSSSPPSIDRDVMVGELRAANGTDSDNDGIPDSIDIQSFPTSVVVDADNDGTHDPADIELGSVPSVGASRIATYPIAVGPRPELQECCEGTPPNPFTGTRAFLVGQAYIPQTHTSFDDGSARGNEDHRSQKVGTNTIQGTNEHSTSATITFKFDEPNNPDEMIPAWSSSGGPSFATFAWTPGSAGSPRVGDWGLGNCLALVGVHRSGVAPLDPQGPEDFLWGTKVSENKTATDLYLANHFYRIRDHIIAQQDLREIPEYERQLPISLSIVPGDFNADQKVDVDDIEILLRESRMIGLGHNRGYNWYLDWNSDGAINDADVAAFTDEHGWARADVNLDGATTFEDFLILSVNFGTEEGMRWEDGNLDGDGDVDFADFLILSANS